MTIATAEQPKPEAVKPDPDLDLARMHPPRLPYHPLMEQRFGVDRASWKALVEAIFPNAQTTESVILALGYCRARKLDPFKRNVHIVPIWSKDLGRMVDTVWPGIGELRTTAFRTGEYAGRDRTQYGPDVTKKLGTVDMVFPEWAQVTVYRMLKGQRVAFAGPQVYWEETYATQKRDTDTPNEMWMTRPRGQIDKCAEAAALRAGFPEEIGSDYIPEEIEHPTKTVTSVAVDGDRPRGNAGLLAKLERRDGSQLSDEEEIEALKQTQDQAAAVYHGEESSGSDSSRPSSPAPESAGGSPAEPAAGEAVPAPVATKDLPDHARTEESYINDLITVAKPLKMTAKQARDAFHKKDLQSWAKLTPERQDQKFRLLVDGDFPW